VTDRAASATALAVATLRAAHQLLDGEPPILDDPVVLRLLDPEVIAGIRANPERFEAPHVRRLRFHVVTRSRHAEDRLAEAVARGVRQYVVLGAGFDTFAYRQPPWASALRIFEVDHPASRDAKRQRLHGAGIGIPPNVEHVAIDFETTPLRDGLIAGGFDTNAPAFVSWLGVMVYLTWPAIDAVFALVASLPAPSEIVFTFTAPKPPDESDALAERAAAAGEPWLTRIEPEALEERLRAHGFTDVGFLTSRVVSARRQ
jgi:methyltransferase (TIGR00027 family)